MSPEALMIVAVGVLVTLLTGLVLLRKLPGKVRAGEYVEQWREIQKMCRNKDDWAHAIIHADMLLDEVMIKKKVSGKTMGERMVNAESMFKSKDAVWNAHKLSGTLRKDGDAKVPKPLVKKTLVAFGQALKDLGAL